MKPYFRIIAFVMFVTNFIACDPKPIDVQDIRNLVGVTLKMNNDNLQWAAGETRICTIVCNPDIAVIDTYQLEQNIEGILEIDPTERPEVFKIMARKAGRVRLKATVTDHNGIIKTAEADFTINGTYQPKMAVKVKEVSDDAGSRAFPKVMVCDVGQVFLMETISDNPSVSFTVASSDPEVLSVKNKGDGKWLLETGVPGETELTVRLRDRFGEKRDKVYTVAVFGHAIVNAEFCISSMIAGISVPHYNLPPVRAAIDFSGSVYGYPEKHNIKRVDEPLYNVKDAINLKEGASQDIIDVRPFANTIINQPPLLDNGILYYYEFSGIRLNYEFELVNPYIILDSIVKPELPDDTDVRVIVNMKQYGVANIVEVVDDEAEEWEDLDVIYVNGWYEHNITVNLD